MFNVAYEQASARAHNLRLQNESRFDHRNRTEQANACERLEAALAARWQIAYERFKGVKR